MKYIDAHCHLDLNDYDKDREEVLGRMKEQEVGAITIGTNLQSSQRVVDIAKRYRNIWACIGVHPHESNDDLPASQGGGQDAGFKEEEFEKLVTEPKVVAIGECGLDFHRLGNDPAYAELQRGKQEKLFEWQIQLALKHNKPLMLHCRDAYEEVLGTLESRQRKAGGKLRGNAHFFAGDINQAKRFLDLGFTLSFTGVVTFTRGYDEVIRYLPQNSIISETDAPFVASVPYRGGRNEPAYVIEVVKKLAEVRGEDVSVLSGAILENCRRVFGLSE